MNLSTGILGFALATLGGVLPIGSAQSIARVLSDEAWNEDIDFFVTSLLTSHPDPFRETDRETFNESVAALRAELPGLADAQVTVGLLRLTSLIADGHTGLWPEDPRFGFMQVVPFRFVEFTDGIFITAVGEEFRAYLGAQLVAIGGTPVEEVLAELAKVTSYDGEFDRRRRAVERLSWATLVQSLGFGEPALGLHLTIKVGEGELVEVDVPSVDARGFGGPWRNELEGVYGPNVSFRELLGDDLPTYFNRPILSSGDQFRFEHLGQGRPFYLQLNSVGESAVGEFKASCERLFAAFESSEADRLVIDLRLNSGGNNQILLPLIHGIIQRPALNQAGKLFVIIGRQTFSAAVGLAPWSQGDAPFRAAIEKAQRTAVEATLRYLEEEAARSRRGRAGAENVESSFVASLFDHCSSRSAMNGVPDPQLHCHALIWNLTYGEDGQWGTLDGRNLFRQKMTAGVLYRAELFHQLRELGLSASRIGKFCELDGIPEHVIRGFSKRRAAIEATLHEKGDYSAIASAKAATQTRKSKTENFRARLLVDWKRQAKAMGFEFERGTNLPLLAVDQTKELERATPKALSVLTETKSYFSKRDYLRAVAKQVEPLGVSLAHIREAVDAWLPRLVHLEASQLGESRFTTRNMVFLERKLVSGAKVLGRRRHHVGEDTLHAALKSASVPLASEQQDALQHITQGGAIAMVSGLAGTGKTTLLRAAREAWESAGYKVHGAALAAQAARGLEQGSGIRSASPDYSSETEARVETW